MYQNEFDRMWEKIKIQMKNTGKAQEKFKCDIDEEGDW